MSEEKTWFVQLKPCRWVLLGLQVWPVCESRGRVVFRKRSPHFVFAALAWTALAVIAFRAVMHWFETIGEAGYFSLKAYFAFFVIVGHNPLIIPFIHWTSLHHVTRAFNYSHRFQAHFLRVFGEPLLPLRVGLARRAMIMGILSPVIGIAFTFWAHFYDYLPWQQFPIYEMSSTYLSILPGTWQVTLFGVEASAQQLLHQLRQVLRQETKSRLATPAPTDMKGECEAGLATGATVAQTHSPSFAATPASETNLGAASRNVHSSISMASGTETASVHRGTPADAVQGLREVHWMWLQLDHSVKLWTHAWTYALAHLLLFSMTTVLLSIFGVSIPLLRVHFLTHAQAGLMVAIFQNVHTINAVGTAGYRVRTQVRDVFAKELLMIKFSSTSAVMYKEVLDLLDSINIQDTKVSLRGYLTVDRALAVTCAALLLTYVVVLLQFAYAKGAQ